MTMAIRVTVTRVIPYGMGSPVSPPWKGGKLGYEIPSCINRWYEWWKSAEALHRQGLMHVSGLLLPVGTARVDSSTRTTNWR